MMNMIRAYFDEPLWFVATIGVVLLIGVVLDRLGVLEEREGRGFEVKRSDRCGGK